LAASVRGAWPEHDHWQREQASKSGHSGTLLDCLSRLGDLDGAAAFLAQQATAGAYGPADNGPLAAVLGQLVPQRASDLLTAVAANNLSGQPGACANLLERCTRTSARDLEPQRGALMQMLGLPGAKPFPGIASATGMALQGRRAAAAPRLRFGLIEPLRSRPGDGKTGESPHTDMHEKHGQL